MVNLPPVFYATFPWLDKNVALRNVGCLPESVEHCPNPPGKPARESGEGFAGLACISQCAVKGVLFPAGANPARQLSLQPEALEAVQGGNELD